MTAEIQNVEAKYVIIFKKSFSFYNWLVQFKK